MKVADDYLEVRVLKSHLVRLFCDPETTRLQRVQVSCASSAHYVRRVSVAHLFALHSDFWSQFLASDVDAADLTDIAVRENDVRYMLCEYRERVREIMAI